MSNKPKYETSLSKINNVMFPLIERQLVGNGMDMDEYAKSCVLNAISSINNTLEVAGIDWNNPQLDQGNITQILLSVASLKLNSSAHPNEVFFTVRNVKLKKKDANGKDIWKKQIEMGIEGDGNDAILSRFGRGIDEVRNHWLVRENDDFKYPSFDGLDMTPPQWTPKGRGKVVKVVYPIIKRSGAVEYHIAEREDVIVNLLAHIRNNLMNETFGIAENRFKANAKQKGEIDKKKDEILNKAEELGLDGTLKDEELRKYISPAWKDTQSMESMIIRKMRNNIVKKIPKDFGNVLSELQYENTSSDFQRHVKDEIDENANQQPIDIEFEEVEEDKPEKEEEPKTEEKEEKPAEKEEPEQDDGPNGQTNIDDVIKEMEEEEKKGKNKEDVPF